MYVIFIAICTGKLCFQFRAAILPNWVLDYFENDDENHDADDDNNSPAQNLSALGSSKTPKTPNNSAAEVQDGQKVHVENDNISKNQVGPTVAEA